MVIELELFSVLSTLVIVALIFFLVRIYQRLARARSKIARDSNVAVLNGEKLAWLYDQAPEPLAILNTHGRLVRVNDAWHEFVGLRGEAFEKFKSEFCVLDERQMADQAYTMMMTSIFKSGVGVVSLPTPIETYLPGRESERRYVSFEYCPLFVPGTKRVDEVLVRFLDFTDRQRASKNARRSRDILDALMSNSPSVVFVKDTMGRYAHVNTKWVEFFGVPAEQAIGKSSSDIFGPQVGVALAQSDAPIYAGTAKQSEETIGKQTFSTIKFPIRDYSGKVIYIAGMATDITDRKRADAERAELIVREESALEASRMKSSFLANMSHELRTPIHGIMGLADLLEGTELGSMQKDYLDSIMKSADTLLTLVNDILDLSKAEAGKIELEATALNFKKVAEEVERTIRAEAWKKGVTIGFEIDKDVPKEVIGDPTRVRQVLMNLVSNALKFTDKGEVAVRLKMGAGKEVLIDVLDTGVGVSGETMSKLFSPFTQADASTTRKYGGTGLGLSISKHLVTLMGGEIGAERRDPRGSRFWFTIPFEVEHATLETIALETKGTFETARALRVLVVEDNSTNQMIVTAALRNLGHSSVVASNGEEALSALGMGQFDLILMDCQMPVMDGYEATRSIRQGKTPASVEIPIIALTANAMRDDRERCLKAGMTDYVSKPAKSADLRHAISRVMSAPRKHQDIA